MVALGSEIRGQFPIFSQASSAGLPLAYLDTAASSQKPQVVIDRVARFFSAEYANIHRGAYTLSANASEHYEKAREEIASFIGARTARSIVFTRGTTESINLVARSSEGVLLKSGDTILLSLLEHHSNIVPWQMLAERARLKVVFANVAEDGSLDIEDFRKKLHSERPKLVAVTHTSNALGTIVPLMQLIPECHAAGALVLVDAAQAVAHQALNVESLGVDFMVFSGHKMYGPTAIGVLYAKESLLDRLPPFHGGGDMIHSVTVQGSTFADYPQKFEAGTPPIAEAIGLARAVSFLKDIGMAQIEEHDSALLAYAYDALVREGGVEVLGPINTTKQQASIISFNVTGIHPHDLATVVDSFNVQLRAGHHCAMPLLAHLKLHATARISFGIYSCRADIDALLLAIQKAKDLFL